MRVDYISTQTMEITTADSYREVEVHIGLHQTHPYKPPSYTPLDGGDPGSDAEWDIATVSLIDEDGKSREFGGTTAMTDILEVLLGQEAWRALVDSAVYDANETYKDGGL